MNKPRVTLRQRVLHLRAIMVCYLLGLGKLRYWVRSKKGIYTYLKGERGEMLHHETIPSKGIVLTYGDRQL